MTEPKKRTRRAKPADVQPAPEVIGYVIDAETIIANATPETHHGHRVPGAGAVGARVVARADVGAPVTDSWSYTAPVVASWARARSSGKRRYTDPRHAEARDCHRLHALAARPRGWRLDGVYVVAVEYRAADARRRDVDRVLSLVLDALIGVAYVDDADRYLAGARVTRWAGPSEVAAEHPAGTTRVRVTRIGDAPAPTAARRRRQKAGPNRDVP